MKKRIMISVLLICSIICSILFPFIVDADSDEKNNFTALPISVSGEIYIENVIVSNNRIFMCVESFSKYTKYQYDSREQLFFIDGQSNESDRVKTVLLRPQQKDLLVMYNFDGSVIYSIDLERIIEHNNTYYLPVDRVLPCLNTITKVDNGTLMINSSGISMMEAMYGFNAEDYLFDIDDVFFSEGLFKVFCLPQFLYDSVSRLRLHRLFVIPGDGSFFDYKTALTSLLKNNEVYLKAVSGETSGLENLMDVFGDGFSINGMFDDAFTIGEYYNATVEVGDKLFDLAGVVDAASTLERGYDMAEYLYTYHNQIEDHYNMIVSVYDSTVINHASERFYKAPGSQYTASQAVKDLYSDQIQSELFGIVHTAFVGFSEELLEAGTLGYYSAVANLTGDILNVIFSPLSYSEKVALLPYYVNIMYSAESALNYYIGLEDMTDVTINNIRLSALLYLNASRECYDILDGYTKAYDDYLGIDIGMSYPSRINNIDARMILLYQAADSVELDSTEHYKEHAKELKKQLAGLIDELKPTEASNNWTENEILSAYRDYFYENYDSNTDKVYICDVTADGIGEMMVVSPLDDETYLSKPYLLYVYTLLSDGTIVQIYSADESNAMHTRHVIGICEYGSNNCLYELDDYVWTGWGSFSQSVFLLDQNGNKNVLMLNGGTIEDGILVDGDNRFKDYTDVMDIVRKPEEVFGPLNISTAAGEGSVRNVQVTCDDASLKATAFDNNGSIVWYYSIESSEDLWFPELEYEVVDGVAVFISDASTHSIIAVDYATGEEMWTHNVEYDSSGAYSYEYGYGSGAGLAYHGGTLYFCCEDSGVVCLAIDGNGREKWRVDAPDGFWGAYKIEVSDEYVVTYSMTQEVDSFYYAQRFNFSGEEIRW